MSNSWNNPIIMQEAQALMALTDELQKPFERAISLLSDVRGKIVCTGIGKSGHVASKIVATMMSTDTPAVYLAPSEMAGGISDSITPGDAVLAISRSGRAAELIPVFEHSRDTGVPVILISENDQDSLAEYADVVLKMPPMQDVWGHGPTTSTIVQMAIGDALAVTLADRTETVGHTDAIALATNPKQPFTKEQVSGLKSGD
jgi:arabinose-5-phosphate isomerase